MPFDVAALLRPHLRELTPYSSARDDFSGEAMVFLDANENPIGSVVEEELNRYPDPRARAVKERLAPLLDVEADQIFLGNGSDEAIDLLIRAFCEPGEQRILITPPTYGMYRVAAGVNAVGVDEVPLTPGYQLDVASIRAALRDEHRLVFLCSPNNPTGNLMDRRAMLAVAASAPGLVVVDEAYIDFAGEGASLIGELAAHPNVVILRTFSKAWGMAAARLGVAIGHPDVIAVLNKIKLPYNLSELAQRVALEAIAHADRKDAFVASILAERQWLAARLAEVPVITTVHASDANFLLAIFVDARGTYERLVERGVVVRDRSRVILCDGALRITVGTRAENEVLLAALAEA